MMYQCRHITATDIPDAWFQCVFNLLQHGSSFITDKGSFEKTPRLEFDYITIQITNPGGASLLPQLNPIHNLPDPVAPDYLDHYLPYLMTGLIEEGEDYSYGNRLCGGGHGEFNQIEHMIKTYKEFGFRNNQMTLQIAKPSDMLLDDPPCLRMIDTRIQDGYLHFFPMFRSWDLWGGFPANLGGIELLKQYCAAEIGVKSGQLICASKGLHMYKYVWEFAEIIRGKTIEEFRNEALLSDNNPIQR